MTKGQGQDDAVLSRCESVAAKIKAAGFTAEVDARELRMSEKIWDSIKKGVPLRVEIGARELDDNSVTYIRRVRNRFKNHSASRSVCIRNSLYREIDT